MATLPTSQIDPGLPFQDPATLAWLRQNVLGIPQAGNTSPIMERLMQTTADPPAGLSDLPSRFYNPNYTPRQSTPSRINYNPMGFPEEASLQGGGGDETLAGGTRSRYQMTARDVEAINNTSARLGINPEDLTAVIAYETIGTMNPDIVGGKGNDYEGLIQFGEDERRDYGYQRGMSFAEQVEGPVYRYLADRGVEPGMDVGRIYRTVNGGNPNAKLTKNDGNGTIAQHIARIKADFLPRAQQMLQAAPTGPDVNAIMDVASRNFAPSAVETPPTAASGFAPTLGGIGGTPAQAAIADLVGQPAPDLTPEQIDFLTMTDEAGNYLNQPPQPQSASPPPSLPPEWAQAAGFPIDEALTGRSGQDVLNGGPRMDPRRAGLATGPMPADMGAMLSPADVLNAGPQLNPRNAIGSAPVGPTTDQGVLAIGPNMRPENRWMAGAGGAPDASMVPSPNPRGTPFAPSFPSLFGEQPPELMGGMSAAMGGPPSLAGNMSAAMGDAPPDLMTDERRQRILSDLDRLRQRDQPYSPMVAGMPDIPRPQFQSMIAGRPEFPGAIQPPRDIQPQAPSEPRVPASTGLTPKLMDRLRQSQGIGPFSSRPEYPGALPAAPNPYDDPSRQFDVPPFSTRMAMIRDAERAAPAPMSSPQPLQEARTKDDAFTLPTLDFSMASEPAPVLMAPPSSPMGPTGNAVAPQNDRGTGRQAFIDANRAPASVDYTKPAWLDLPDPTPSGLQSPPVADWRDQFNISFSPGGPGMIADLTPPQSPTPSVSLPSSNPFDALMGPSMGMALPFDEVPSSSPWANAPAGNLGLDGPAGGTVAPPSLPSWAAGMDSYVPNRFQRSALGGGSVIETPQPGQPGVVQGTMPTPAGAMDIRPPAQLGVMPSMPDPMATPTPPPRPTQTEMQRKSAPSLFQGPMGGLLHAVAPKLFPNAGQGIGSGLAGPAGGLLGFLASKNPPSFTAGGASGVAPSSSGGTANWQHGSVGNNPGMRYTTSNGVTVTTMTDPFTGATYTGYG